MIVDPGDDDFPLEAGVAEQGSWDHDPSLLFQLRLSRAGVALQLAALAAERIETRDACIGTVPPSPRVCVEAAVHAARDDDAVGHRIYLDRSEG